MEQNNNFNFFVPLEFEKGTSSSEPMKIKGVASSASEDSDGETLYPSGFNVMPLLSTGFLNYNHQASKSSAAIIGEPTKAEIVNGGKDLYIEGFLYPDSDEAKSVYKLAQTLEKNSKTRRLGFSIEGKATKRDPFNPKKILAADITSVAITACPKNPNTLLSIMKGEYQQPLISNEENNDEEIDKAITTATADTGNGGLKVEDVEGGQKVIKDLINSDRKILEKSEIYSEIIKQYPFVEFQKAKEIYQFIEQVNQKLFNMDNTTDNGVLSEALQKSFDILNQEFSLIKSENTQTAEPVATTETPAAEPAAVNADLEKGKDEKELEKAKDEEDEDCSYINNMAKKRIEKGMSKDDCVNDMVSKGISLEAAQTSVQKVISEAEALAANGDKEGTPVTAPIVKAEEIADLIKSQLNDFKPSFDFSPIEDLIKGQVDQFETLLTNQSQQIQQRFAGLGSILKSISEENVELRKSNEAFKQTADLLQKSFDQLQGRIQTVERTPVRSNNTVTTQASIDRFAKSQDAVGDQFSMSNPQDVTLLGDRLMEEFELSKGRGRQDTVLEKAITDLEMLGGFQPHTLQALHPRLRAMKINIVE